MSNTRCKVDVRILRHLPPTVFNFSRARLATFDAQNGFRNPQRAAHPL